MIMIIRMIRNILYSVGRLCDFHAINSNSKMEIMTCVITHKQDQSEWVALWNWLDAPSLSSSFNPLLPSTTIIPAPTKPYCYINFISIYHHAKIQQASLLSEHFWHGQESKGASGEYNLWYDLTTNNWHISTQRKRAHWIFPSPRWRSS